MEARLVGVRWPVVVAGALTFGTGALDVLALVHLGGVFASVMTGNLVLLGLGSARADTTATVDASVALLGYVLGVAAGSRTTGGRVPDAPLWPRRVTVVLVLELGLLAGLTAGWVGSGAGPDRAVRVAMLAVAATAMGLQGAAVRGLGVPLATTYLTGTLTSMVAAGAGPDGRGGLGPGIASVLGALAGAACSGLVLRVAPMAAPALVLAPLAGILALLIARRRSLRRPGPRTGRPAPRTPTGASARDRVPPPRPV